MWIDDDYNAKTKIKTKSELEREKKKKDKEKFNLTRRLFLRKYTHDFLAFDIYTKFNDFFGITVIRSFDEGSFNQVIGFFLEEIMSLTKNIEHNHALLDLELAKDILRLNDNLPTEYIIKEEIAEYEVYQLKNKIASILLGQFVLAESYRCVIEILKDSKLTADILVKSAATFEQELSVNTNYGKFSIGVRQLLIDVINSNIDEVYFFDDVSSEHEKLEILNNTMTIFNQIDKVILDDTLLDDFEITKEAFHRKFNDIYAQNILDKLYENLTCSTHELHRLIKADVLVLNSAISEESKSGVFIFSKKSDVSKIETASLYYFLRGVLNGFPAVIFAEVLMDGGMNKDKSRRLRVLKKLDKYEADAKLSYLLPLRLLRLLIDHHKHKNIIFMVYIAKELCLNKAEAWKLSEALGLNSRKTFYKHFNDFYEVIYPNYQHIK